MRIGLLTGVLLSLGCSDRGSLTTPSATDDDPDGTLELTYADWTPCAWEPGVDTARAECTHVELPLDYGDPQGATLKVLVKRLPADGEEAGQYWVLHGGPGASAIDDLSGLSYGLEAEFPDYGLYAVDHRGIGGSGQLTCPQQESSGSDGGTVITLTEWPGCLEHLDDEWGEDLPFLNTTNSARDIGTLIDLFAAGDAEIFVYGGSYGTYLAQRYLHLFPEQPSGVILDGIMPATRTFVGYDGLMNDTAHDLFDLCAADPQCSDHFAGDPWQVATDVVMDLDNGHCASLGSTTADMRTILGYLSIYWPVRDYLPALTHRIERCTVDDAAAIIQFVDVILGASIDGNRAVNDGLGRSNVLGKYIAMSELWDPQTAPTPAQAEASLDSYTMALGVEWEMANLQATWPFFELDAYHDVLPAYRGPLMMMQGGLDPATVTSEAQKLENEYTGTGQTWAFFPFGAHGLVTTTYTAGGQLCGYDLVRSFMDDPAADLDLGCIDDVLPPDFTGDPATSLVLFGAEDPWEG